MKQTSLRELWDKIIKKNDDNNEANPFVQPVQMGSLYTKPQLYLIINIRPQANEFVYRGVLSDEIPHAYESQTQASAK